MPAKVAAASMALMVFSVLGAMAPAASAEVLSLDGPWEIVFDPANEGREARWFEDEVFAGLDTRRDITVPSAWELIEEDYEGVAFYRKAFDVPAGWKDHVVRLQFGAVNYICEVWLNGEAVGVHEGGFTPFEFRVDRVLKPGEANVLLLRVVGPIFFEDKKVDGIGALWKNGRRATGLVFSAGTVAMKFGSGIAGAATGWILMAFGYVANADQTPEALLGIRLLMSLIPAGAALLLLLLIQLYRIDDATLATIEADLATQRKTAEA